VGRVRILIGEMEVVERAEESTTKRVGAFNGNLFCPSMLIFSNIFVHVAML
jgi:hypothetical protein